MPGSGPLEAAAAHVLANDAELQDRVRGLVTTMLDEAERVMATGTPASRSSLVRSMLPTVIKEARAHEADGKLTELQATVTALHAAIREGIGPAPIPTLTDPPVDLPPIDHPVPVADNVVRITGRG